jgi:hypothetical protein
MSNISKLQKGAICFPFRAFQITPFLIEKPPIVAIQRPTLFDQKNLAEISGPDYPGERLIACRNPFLAQRRAQKREALLEVNEVELQKIVLATQRQRAPLRGKAKMGLQLFIQ